MLIKSLVVILICIVQQFSCNSTQLQSSTPKANLSTPSTTRKDGLPASVTFHVPSTVKPMYLPTPSIRTSGPSASVTPLSWFNNPASPSVKQVVVGVTGTTPKPHNPPSPSIRPSRPLPSTTPASWFNNSTSSKFTCYHGEGYAEKYNISMKRIPCPSKKCVLFFTFCDDYWATTCYVSFDPNPPEHVLPRPVRAGRA